METVMKIELKNVRHSKVMSQETDCFMATVYVDGVKAGTAENSGHGGATVIRPRVLEAKIEAYAATLPKAPLRMSDDPGAEVRDYQPTAETVIGDLLETCFVERDLRKTLSKCVVFTMPGRAEVLKSKVVPVQRLRLALQDPAKVREQLGGADKILNLLPLAEAVAILRAAPVSSRAGATS